MSRLKKIYTILLVCVVGVLSAKTEVFPVQIDWIEVAKTSHIGGDHYGAKTKVNGGSIYNRYNRGPEFKKVFSINDQQIIDAETVTLSSISIDDLKGHENMPFLDKVEALSTKFYEGLSAGERYGYVVFNPVYKDNTGQIRLITSCEIKVEMTKAEVPLAIYQKAFNNQSKLSTGDWYKIGVEKEGVYKMSYNSMMDLGVDLSSLQSNDIQLYAGQIHMLPHANNAPRVDDLQQLAIEIFDGGDGVFNQGDYLLFYGSSPHSWKYNTAADFYEHTLHQYADTSFYFLTTSSTGETPKRVISRSSEPSHTVIVDGFDDYKFHENDWTNLIKSGSLWVGDYFDGTTSYDYVFQFPNVELASDAKVKVTAVGRSDVSSEISVQGNGGNFSVPFGLVSLSNYYGTYGDMETKDGLFSMNSDILNLKLTYNKPKSTSVAWLDEIEVNARRRLVMDGNQMWFRDKTTVGAGNIAKFAIDGADSHNVWDVTDPFNVVNQEGNVVSNEFVFNTSVDELKEFVVFNDQYSEVLFLEGKIVNQNLHELTDVDYVIVAAPDFLQEAERLTAFHRANGLKVELVSTQELYNEFSGGKRDVVAIRELLRMLYERGQISGILPKYLLLFGDGSYDNKNRLTANTNFIPTFQSAISLDVIGSYVSDDFYGLLDPNEGVWNSGPGELIDIAVGRLPVKTLEEAKIVVDKILGYADPLFTMKDWRNQVCFIGDDEDSNTHMDQSYDLSTMVDTGAKAFDVRHILFDLYKQETTPGGNRYPEVVRQINNTVNSGALIMNYSGHGGEVGLAHERVVTIPDIYSWENPKNLPLFVTATCEFSRFDDPARTSAGEIILLRENGGGIGLLTTVRLVYATPNFYLNQTFYHNVFKKTAGEYPTIGEVFKKMKIQNATTDNARNFTLLGDPALKLNYPKYNVVIDSLNGKSVLATNIDTLRALGKVTFTGHLEDDLGQKLSGYNGLIYPTVYDKKKAVKTLDNDNKNKISQYDIRTNKLFKGKASVVNGDFTYSFVVPKDISYNLGKGKLSHYASDNKEDANGAYRDFYIGGTSKNFVQDTKGPDLTLYMNDESFVFGGMTDESPSLLAYVYDLHGINMVGNGIGHDITAVLDGKTESAFILNDYYEADTNSYQSGVIRFPFTDLEEGRHTLSLKVWDVYNNSADATIDFVVVKSKDIVLDHVYNYPNPFTTHTEFWFEHNQPQKNIFVQVQVYTVSGKLVKTIEQNMVTTGYRSFPISWDGRDDFGGPLAKGVYVYKLTVRASNFSTAEHYEKLVILR